jgi:hypothetical protein
MERLYAKFCEFNMHIKGYMNLSLFSLSEFCRLAEQEFRRLGYIKDVVQKEGIPTKLNL